MRSRTSTWFETKVKYQKTMEDGSEKVVSEAYVVDALSFTEAESAIIDETLTVPICVMPERAKSCSIIRIGMILEEAWLPTLMPSIAVVNSGA